ncbi:Aminotransferase DegT [Candidatus Electrothrix gigas]
MITHNKPTLEQEEQKAALNTIKSGWVAQGSEVEQFENEFCDFLGLPNQHAVALSSGTAALFMALWVLSAGNKTVALPVYVCSALRNAVGLVNATEILIDTEQNSPNICLSMLQDSHAKIAIIPHMFGIPTDLTRINDIEIIEDCAQSIGTSIHGVPVGLHGTVGIFSFYATKLITSGGQGGMLVSKDKTLIDAVRDYRNFDCRKDKKYRFNFQLTDLQAAIGRVQLQKLPPFLARRSEIFEMYQEAGLTLLDAPQSMDCVSVRYRAVMKTSVPQKIIDHLLHNGIKTIVPIEDWELLGQSNLFPNAHYLTQHTVSLPIYPSLSDIEIYKIIKTIKETLE